MCNNFFSQHMANETEAREAIGVLNGSTHNGRRLNVEESTSEVRQKPGMGGSDKCFFCGDGGHWSRDCPKLVKPAILARTNIMNVIFLQSFQTWSRRSKSTKQVDQDLRWKRDRRNHRRRAQRSFRTLWNGHRMRQSEELRLHRKCSVISQRLNPGIHFFSYFFVAHEHERRSRRCNRVFKGLLSQRQHADSRSIH